MSEQANTALIQSLYAAFNRGDIETILANVDPQAEWVDYGPSEVPYFGNFTGRMMEFFQAMEDSTTGGNVAIERYIASGDTVVTEGRYTGAVRSTGAKINEPLVHIFTLRGGKVISWRGYGDTAAVAAAHAGKAASA